MSHRGFLASGAMCALLALTGCADVGNGVTSGSAGPAASALASVLQSDPVVPPSTEGATPTPAGSPLSAPPLVDDTGRPVTPVVLAMVRAIYAAAVAGDYAALQHLLTKACFRSNADYQKQLQLWRQPGELLTMRKVLLTHGAATDGYTFPGFALAGWHSHYDYEDAGALDVVAPPKPTSDASSYHGPRMVISFGPGATVPTWCGISNSF